MSQPESYYGKYLFTFSYYDKEEQRNIEYNISGSSSDFFAYLVSEEENYPKQIEFWRFTDEVQYFPVVNSILAQAIINEIKKYLEIRKEAWVAHP